MRFAEEVVLISSDVEALPSMLPELNVPSRCASNKFNNKISPKEETDIFIENRPSESIKEFYILSSVQSRNYDTNG